MRTQKKPNSIKIREQVLKDILSVDPSKWFHPKLPNGEVNMTWGTIEVIDGKEVHKPGDVDLYVYKHPDLNYNISDYPLGTCKEGEFNNVTKKDCGIIRDALYWSRGRTTYSNCDPKNLLNPNFIRKERAKEFLDIFLWVVVPMFLYVLLFVIWPKSVFGATFALGVIVNFGYLSISIVEEFNKFCRK